VVEIIADCVSQEGPKKCGRCGEIRHNVRTCLGLSPVGREERALE
jgi:hypothetical protein